MAKFYIVSYDLHNQRNYPRLIEAIKKFKHVQILESLWSIVSDKSCSDLRDHLQGFIDNDDSLFVIKAAGGSNRAAAWTRLMDGADKFIKDNLDKSEP